MKYRFRKRRNTKKYNHNGFAGCVQIKINRLTKLPVGVYHSNQSGLENDPTQKWSAVCETHSYLICTTSLKSAKECAAHPDMWCEDCQDIVKNL